MNQKGRPDTSSAAEKFADERVDAEDREALEPNWRHPISYVQATLARIPDKVRHPIMDVCGVLCLVMPLFIYASLEFWLAKAIVVAGAIAFVVLIVLVWSYPHDEF